MSCDELHRPILQLWARSRVEGCIGSPTSPTYVGKQQALLHTQPLFSSSVYSTLVPLLYLSFSMVGRLFQNWR